MILNILNENFDGVWMRSGKEIRLYDLLIEHR